jgi:hypothetical protein
MQQGRSSMSTIHTPPIDLYEETDDRPQDTRDDRETGFVFPDDNGDRDEPAVQAGERRLHAVLGW